MPDPIWGQEPGAIWGQTSLIWGFETPVVEDIINLDIFRAPLLDDTTRQLAQHLPQGRAWAYKLTEGTNTYGLIRSAAAAFNRVQQQIETLANQFDIPLTSDLLPNWEESVGLPDDCQSVGQDLTARRNNIITRLRRIAIVTKAEFEALGQELIGIPVTVTPGQEVDMPPTKHSRFKLYVTFPTAQSEGFPYSFPFGIGGFRSDVVECVFNKIVPASVLVILQ